MKAKHKHEPSNPWSRAQYPYWAKALTTNREENERCGNAGQHANPRRTKCLKRYPRLTKGIHSTQHLVGVYNMHGKNKDIEVIRVHDNSFALLISQYIIMPIMRSVFCQTSTLLDYYMQNSFLCLLEDAYDKKFFMEGRCHKF
jgi:hypothetical protein